MTRGSILIDLEEQPALNVQDAAPVPDFASSVPKGQAMQLAARMGARKPSRLARWFWTLLVGLVTAVVWGAAWNFVSGLLARSPLLGWAIAGLGTAFLLVTLAMLLRELARFARLRRVDQLRSMADLAVANRSLHAARDVVDRLDRFYSDRSETGWGRARLSERRGEVIDADALLELAEVEVLAPLDQMAQREVEAAARQVAAVTALVPLAMADVVAALVANMRMIRRVAEIYGGRVGTLGNWRLFRAVMTHMVTTGAVAVGDDLIGTLAGGGALAKISRRFGEGLVNGALTARVGVAAMNVCRPLPYSSGRAPKASGLVKRALMGLFDA